MKLPHRLRAGELLTLSAALAIMAPSRSPGDDSSERAERQFAEARQRMVERQLKPRRRGIRDERVLAAMATVPRHEFVPVDLRHEAYEDTPLPIGEGQTISQPYIVAFMTEKLQPEAHETVLEIGTGSGYQAAILSGLVKEVYSIEIVDSLARQAADTLERLGYDNVKVRSGDGYAGWPEQAPFDAIIVTCAPDEIPQPLLDQLKEGGRMMIPVGDRFAVQELFLLEKKNGKVEKQAVLPVRFVPMTGKSEED